MSIESVRELADAVLYDGYLLYPYRTGAAKNRSRWQFGVLGPPGAAGARVGEAPDMTMQCLVDVRRPDATVTVHLRFLHLQARVAQLRGQRGGWMPAEELNLGETSVLTWDEAVEREVAMPPLRMTGAATANVPVDICGGTDIEELTADGRIVRRRWPLTGSVRLRTEADEVLTLRVMTMTDAEKAGTRATDPRAKAIADRSDW